MTSRLEIASFLFHDVTDNPGESGFQRRSALPYKISKSEFLNNLEEIATSNMIPKLIFEVDFNRPDRHLILTFDDGGKSAIHINDLLSKRGWRGHFLITTSLIDTRHFLSKEDIRYIRSCGHNIGSHSHTHPDIFKDQTLAEMLNEWTVSCDVLAQMLGEPCLTASVPGGDISRKVLDSAHRTGILYLFTSEPWLTPRRIGNCWVLGRVCPKVGTPLDTIRNLTHFRGWTKALIYRRIQVLARNALYPAYKFYVYGTINKQHK